MSALTPDDAQHQGDPVLRRPSLYVLWSIRHRDPPLRTVAPDATLDLIVLGPRVRAACEELGRAQNFACITSQQIEEYASSI